MEYYMSLILLLSSNHCEGHLPYSTFDTSCACSCYTGDDVPTSSTRVQTNTMATQVHVHNWVHVTSTVSHSCVHWVNQQSIWQILMLLLDKLVKVHVVVA